MFFNFQSNNFKAMDHPNCKKYMRKCKVSRGDSCELAKPLSPNASACTSHLPKKSSSPPPKKSLKKIAQKQPIVEKRYHAHDRDTQDLNVTSGIYILKNLNGGLTNGGLSPNFSEKIGGTPSWKIGLFRG